MKKKYIVFGAVAFSSICGFGQQPVNYVKKKIAKSTIEVVYSQYIQNGDHSAITGGIGTEKLLVYEPEIIINKQVDSLNAYSVDVGIDVITSASLDNIDFVMSSASRVSKRGYLRLGYERTVKQNRNLSFGGSGYFSIESAYTSLGASLSAEYTSPDKSKAFSAELESYFDDLRWGRLNGERPLRLVYPVELRYREWYDEYKRRSFNLNLSYQQTINEKMVIAFFPGASYQFGLLATPYHRVYFKDSSERVENVPDKRFKIPLGVQLNSFIGRRSVLRVYYRFYKDDFGIIAHTLNTEFAMKLTPGWTLTPLLHLYTQTAASFFKPYEQHDPSQQFYTSDYDLSAFNSYEAGIESRFAGIGKGEKGFFCNVITLRYSYYKRSEGLHAHLITLLMDFMNQKRK